MTEALAPLLARQWQRHRERLWINDIAPPSTELSPAGGRHQLWHTLDASAQNSD